MGSRRWSLQQRIECSRRSMKHGLVRETKYGRLYRGLIWHLVCATHYEGRLIYEAAHLNDSTLEEWLARHREGGRPTREEIYLPPGFVIMNLSGDRSSVHPGNLYCFVNKRERTNWLRAVKRKVVRLPDNEKRIRELAVEFTSTLRSKCNHPQTCGELRMTHTVWLNLGASSLFGSCKEVSVKCELTGSRTVSGGMAHLEVELADGQKFWVFEGRVFNNDSGGD